MKGQGDLGSSRQENEAANICKQQNLKLNYKFADVNFWVTQPSRSPSHRLLFVEKRLKIRGGGDR